MSKEFKVICRECQYLKAEIAKVGRNCFYCMHPEAKTECMPHRRIAQSREKDIPIKSTPRWCPLKQSMKEGKL